MSTNKVHMVMSEVYPPGRWDSDYSIYRVFTTPEVAEACRARLTAKWGTGGCAPQFSVQVHDVVVNDIPGQGEWG